MASSRPRIGGAVAGAAILIAGCGAAEPDRDAASPGPQTASEAAIEHVHGLGVIEDELYVATHRGLLTMSPEGQVHPAGSAGHDFMGFTVTSADQMLASGHPNGAGDLPANLGLLTSDDNGTSWQHISLSGEVDFHALDAKGGIVYGFDATSGQLLTSTDRQDWDSLGQIPLADVTISPQESSTLLITTENGPQASTDGGQTFTALAQAPVLALVDWPRSDELYGIGPDGAVYRSIDDGTSWQQQGHAGGPPHAMTVATDGEVYVALDDAIVASADAGNTFTPVYHWG